MIMLNFDTPLSETGVRDLHLDLTKPLKYQAETISTLDVVSSDNALLLVSLIQINTIPVGNDNGTIGAIGKAAQFRVTTVKTSTSPVWVDVIWLGTGGSRDTHRLLMNLTPQIRR